MNMRELKEEINAYLEKVEFYERKLEEIGLTFKTYNCLHRYKFKQLSDLIGKNFDDLMSIKNLGEKGVNEIFQLAAKFGLKIQNNVITGSICEQSDEIKQKIDKLGSVKIKDMGFNFKTLEYLECCYTLSDILDKRISNLRSEHKDVYQDFIYVMGKYGFTLNKTGYFVLIDLTTKDSILFRALKKLGLKALFLCDKKYFTANTVSLTKIENDVEIYLNWLVQQKLTNAKKENFDSIENEIDVIRRGFLKYLKNQMNFASIDIDKKVFVSKMAVKNTEARMSYYETNEQNLHSYDNNSNIDI